MDVIFFQAALFVGFAMATVGAHLLAGLPAAFIVIGATLMSVSLLAIFDDN